MEIPITAKLGSLALLITASLLVGTLLYLIIEHNRQIQALQATISHMCIVAMGREHAKNLNLDD